VRLLALIALLAFAVPTVAGATGRSRHTGVLHGVVTRGPACTPGIPQPCTDPIPDVKIVFLRQSQPVGQTTTTDAGTYRIRLQAGRYGIRLPGRDQWQPTQVRVLRGRTARLNIAIDALNG
jgi:Carboxypeptidase regulatory-like domain